MVTHLWGDENFDWEGLDAACEYVALNLRFWRVDVRQYKEKFGCYDAETMVLTNNGWKYFENVDIKTDEFATLVDQHIEYIKATKYHKYKYSGLLYRLKTRGVDLAVTPNHRIYAAKADIHGGIADCGHKNFPLKLQTYEELFRKPKRFERGAKWKGKRVETFRLPEYVSTWIPCHNFKRVHKRESVDLPIKPWLEFLGWYIAEGSANKSDTSLGLCNVDGGKAFNRALSAVKALGFQYSIDRSRNSVVIIRVREGSRLVNWLLDNCGRGARNKQVPNFIKSLPPDDIQLFLESLYAGDGYMSETAHILSTVSETLAYDVMELLLKSGHCGRMTTRPLRTGTLYKGRVINSNYPEICVNWLKKTSHQTINSHDTSEMIKEKENFTEYNGEVFCVTVPTGLLYVMRDGKPVWCGNSCRIYCTIGLTCLHQLTHPGYVYNQWPAWLWRLQFTWGARLLTRALNIVVFPFHCWLYRYYYKKAVQKWPHLAEEILCAADYKELLDGLGK